MPPVQTAESFVVKRRGLGTTKTVLYLGTLLFGLMVLLTLSSSSPSSSGTTTTRCRVPRLILPPD